MVRLPLPIHCLTPTEPKPRPRPKRAPQPTRTNVLVEQAKVTAEVKPTPISKGRPHPPHPKLEQRLRDAGYRSRRKVQGLPPSSVFLHQGILHRALCRLRPPKTGSLRCNAFWEVGAPLVRPLDSSKPDPVRRGRATRAANHPLPPKSQARPCIHGRHGPPLWLCDPTL